MECKNLCRVASRLRALTHTLVYAHDPPSALGASGGVRRSFAVQGRRGYKARRDSNRGRPTARKSRLKRLLQAVLKKYSAETL